MNFLLIYVILFIYFTIWFVISQIKKNNGLIDIAWGFSFIITTISSIIISRTININKIILLVIILVWGTRLSYYLLKRNWNKPEDFRYQAMRKKWKTNIMLKSFIKVFLTQSVLSYLISMPIILNNLYAKNNLNIFNIILLTVGVGIFIFGFIFEVIADKNLRDFKKDPNNKGKILTTGVWSMSRHPNYFGEATLWWGIGIISISTLIPITFIGLISPLVMTLLLRYVSGVPLLEKRYIGNKEFEEYKKTTPIFIPKIKKQP